MSANDKASSSKKMKEEDSQSNSQDSQSNYKKLKVEEQSDSQSVKGEVQSTKVEGVGEEKSEVEWVGEEKGEVEWVGKEEREAEVFLATLETRQSIVEDAGLLYRLTAHEQTMVRLANEGCLFVMYPWDEEYYEDFGLLLLHLVRLDTEDDAIASYGMKYVSFLISFFVYFFPPHLFPVVIPFLVLNHHLPRKTWDLLGHLLKMSQRSGEIVALVVGITYQLIVGLTFNHRVIAPTRCLLLTCTPSL